MVDCFPTGTVRLGDRAPPTFEFGAPRMKFDILVKATSGFIVFSLGRFSLATVRHLPLSLGASKMIFDRLVKATLSRKLLAELG